MRALPRSLFAVNTVKASAGVLLYRRNPRTRALEVLLAHLGGPFYATKDDGVWSLPKGTANDEESYLVAAKRDFTHMLGATPPAGPYRELGFVSQRSGSAIHAWAAEGEFEPRALASQSFALEWPPASGQQRHYPEVDRVAWFDVETARRKMTTAQLPLLSRLVAALLP